MTSRDIRTVLGPVSPGDLGITLMHEHLAVGLDGAMLDSRWIPDHDDVVRTCVKAVNAGEAAGLRTLVDATTIEMGRDPRVLVEVARQTRVNILCSTGLYAASHGIPAHFREMTVEDLTALYVSEIQEGIGRSGVRCGVIKVATSGPDMCDVERRVLTAAARAQKATGVPIITHTAGGGGDEQARLLLQEGADPARIVIGHLDHKNSSARYLLRILRFGVYAGFDRVGLEAFLPDWFRAALFTGLIRQGFVERLILSMDAAARWIGPLLGTMTGAPAPYKYLLEEFVPRLRSLGVTDEEIRQVLVLNPQRLLEG